MVNKKAQMKIQQMAFMLIAITLFFVLVGLFIVSAAFSGLKDKAKQLEEQEAITLVSKLANSPEFSCGTAYGGQKVNCIDLDKLIPLIQNNETIQRILANKISRNKKTLPRTTRNNLHISNVYKL